MPENWDRPQQVTLSAGEDDDQDDGSATVAHVVTSFDAAYREPGPMNPVSERDNDLQVSGRADPPGESGSDMYRPVLSGCIDLPWSQRHQSVFVPETRRG